jgi:hypothetical protein
MITTASVLSGKCEGSVFCATSVSAVDPCDLVCNKINDIKGASAGHLLRDYYSMTMPMIALEAH